MTLPPLPALKQRLRARNRARSWLLRAPVLAGMAYLALRLLEDPSRPSLWGGINLAVHEIGHVLFLVFPEFLTVAGGTFLELAIPVVAGLLFLRQKEDFGAALCLFWLATALLGAATYAADARAQLLPLVSPFAGAPMHDWHYLLGRLGLLDRDQAVAGVFRAAGLLLAVGSVGLGGWILGLMATDPERARAGGRGKADPLTEEGLRFRAWLEKEDGSPSSGTSGDPGAPIPPPSRAAPPAAPSASPPAEPSASPPAEPPARAGERLADSVDPAALSAEERRFLEFLEREGEDD